MCVEGENLVLAKMQEIEMNIARNIDIKYGLAYNLIKHINVENN